MWARSGPPYCIVHARVGSSGSATAREPVELVLLARVRPAAAQLDPHRVRPGARDLDGQPRAVGRRARGGPLVVAAAAGQRRGGEQGGQETGEASHGRTTPARPIRHTDALARGWVQSSAGADGVCSTSAPAVFALTPGGRAALRASA